MTNPLKQLESEGQSIWLDYLHEKILRDGELWRLITDDGLKGLTSNPSIFEKAIGGGDAYDARLTQLLARDDASIDALYEAIAVTDIQNAADLFRPVFDRLNGADGFASIEVSPYLANDTEGTIAEARRLWRAVDRPNVMIKVPGTAAGVPAVRQLTSEGININITLLFALNAYNAVAEAYMAGLEDLRARGGDVSKAHSVASFFLSRIDVEIDKKIDAEKTPARAALRGKIAIASAKVAYQEYLARIQSPRWRALAAAGATPQRLLWASTGTKDPSFPDTLYVSELIGPDTINTLPPKTMDAFRDHGAVRATLIEGVDDARDVLAQTKALGLDLDDVTDRLVTDGVALFCKAFDDLRAAIADKRAKIIGETLNTQSIALPEDLRAAYQQALDTARAQNWVKRVWAHDSSLWTGHDEDKWLAWLTVGQGVDVDALIEWQRQIKADDYAHVVLMGMGGSSLGAEVFARTFAPRAGFPKLLVLDSTDPAQIARVRAQIDPSRTLFIVSSKSGSTLEPNILCDYFWDQARTALGRSPGDRFVAITDPGSPLEERARREGFAHVFLGDQEIGGRYSVLSYFGLVAAATLGLDLAQLVKHADEMARECASTTPDDRNPALALGLLLGVAARAGRDKVTIFAADPIGDLGAWLEQLLAESTGKQGRGLIPVNDEPIGAPNVYGADRVFVSVQTGQGAHEGALEALEAAGHPVVRIAMADPGMLGQEFFRWEMAVAIAGAVLEINPFDQPDVEASKVKARALTDAYEKSGALEPQKSILKSDGVALSADARNAEALAQLARDKTVEAYVRAHLQRAHAGDYIGVLAYVDRNDENVSAMRDLRRRVRDKTKRATVAGFGPRFLHSTGQAYKGGPNSGVFLELTGAPADDIDIPGRRASFAVVEQAQARGDFDVLAERDRRVLRIDLASDVEHGLSRLLTIVSEAVEGK